MFASGDSSSCSTGDVYRLANSVQQNVYIPTSLANHSKINLLWPWDLVFGGVCFFICVFVVRYSIKEECCTDTTTGICSRQNSLKGSSNRITIRMIKSGMVI